MVYTMDLDILVAIPPGHAQLVSRPQAVSSLLGFSHSAWCSLSWAGPPGLGGPWLPGWPPHMGCHHVCHVLYGDVVMLRHAMAYHMSLVARTSLDGSGHGWSWSYEPGLVGLSSGFWLNQAHGSWADDMDLAS